MFPSFLSLQYALGVLSLVCPPAEEQKSQQDDALLVASARLGNRGSQSLLYRKYAPALIRRATRMLAQRDEADDVLQDSFIEAFRDLHQLQDPTRFSHWLMRIATHQIHKRFRRRKLLSRLGLDSKEDAHLEQLIDPGASAELSAHCAQLDIALRSLSSAERIVWTLRFIEGCQLSEIVSHTDASLATVKRRLSRAQKHVQSYFKDKLPPLSTELNSTTNEGANE